MSAAREPLARSIDTPGDEVVLDGAAAEAIMRDLLSSVKRAKRAADKPVPTVLVTPDGWGDRRERRAAERAAARAQRKATR